MKNSHVFKSEIDRWFEQNREQMIDDICELISIRSVRGNPEDGKPFGAGPAMALEKAAGLIKSRGFNVTNFDNYMITADINGQEPELGILAHLDVVCEGTGWNTDPFRAEIIDGRLYGRGTSDDKGPAVAALYAMSAVRDIAPNLTRGCQLILGSAEETGSEDLAYYRKKEKMPPYVFTPDADFPVINIEKGRFAPGFAANWEENINLPRIISIKGGDTTNIVPNFASAIIEGMQADAVEKLCAEFSKKTGAAISASASDGQIQIEARGSSAHAAHPEDGINAQTALLSMLTSMPFAESEGFERLCALAKLFPHGDTSGNASGIAMQDEISGKLTLNFGVLRYDITGLEGTIDIRMPVCAPEEDIADKIDKLLYFSGIRTKDRTTLTLCHHVDEKSEFVQTLLNVYEEYTGEKGYCRAVGGGTYVHGIPGGVAFGCAMPEIDYKIHGANEFIGVDEIILSAKMFAAVILDMCL